MSLVGTQYKRVHIMKLLAVFALCAATTATAVSVHSAGQVPLGDSPSSEKYLIELSPGDTRWVTEDEKWALRRVWPSASLLRGMLDLH